MNLTTIHLLFIELLRKISIWIVLFPTIVGCFSFRYLNRDSKIIFVIVIASTMAQMVDAFLPNDVYTKNIFYNLYTFLEFILMWLLFYDKISNINFRTVYIITFWILEIITVFAIINYGIENRFLNEMVCFGNLLYVLWMLMYIQQHLFSDNKFDINTPFVLFLLGLFFMMFYLFLFLAYITI